LPKKDDNGISARDRKKRGRKRGIAERKEAAHGFRRPSWGI